MAFSNAVYNSPSADIARLGTRPLEAGYHLAPNLHEATQTPKLVEVHLCPKRQLAKNKVLQTCSSHQEPTEFGGPQTKVIFRRARTWLSEADGRLRQRTSHLHAAWEPPVKRCAKSRTHAPTSVLQSPKCFSMRNNRC